jgi:hypothetical protein
MENVAKQVAVKMIDTYGVSQAIQKHAQQMNFIMHFKATPEGLLKFWADVGIELLTGIESSKRK